MIRWHSTAITISNIVIIVQICLKVILLLPIPNQSIQFSLSLLKTIDYKTQFYEYNIYNYFIFNLNTIHRSLRI